MPILADAPQFIALEKGYWNAARLNVVAPVSFIDVTAQAELVIADKLDAITSNADPATNDALLRGAPLVIIGGNAVVPPAGARPSAVLMVSDKLYRAGVKSVRDLKGHSVAVWPGLATASGLQVALVLKQAGLTLKDVKARSWSNQVQMMDAFEAGTINVIWSEEPQTTLIMERNIGAHVLAASNQVDAGDPVNNWFANATWVKDNPEATVRLLEGHLRAVGYYMDALESNFQRNADVPDILAKYTHVPVSVIRKAGLNYYARDGLVDAKRIQADMVFLKQLGAISEVAPFAEHTDLSYVKEAYTRLKRSGEL